MGCGGRGKSIREFNFDFVKVGRRQKKMEMRYEAAFC